MGTHAEEGDVWQIASVRFECTSDAVPEQYDATCGIRRVGYVRLRGGRLRVACPDIGGETVLHEVFADPWKGEFEDARERTHWLSKIAERILRWRAERAGPGARQRRALGLTFVEGADEGGETHAVRDGVQEIATLRVRGGAVGLCYTELERLVKVPLGGSAAIAGWERIASEGDRMQWMEAGARALRRFIEDRQARGSAWDRAGFTLTRRAAPAPSPVAGPIKGAEIDVRDARGRRAGYIRMVDGQSEARAPGQEGESVFEGWRARQGEDAVLDACLEAIAAAHERTSGAGAARAVELASEGAGENEP